jgi:branched-chain amino acid aminotransferase
VFEGIRCDQIKSKESTVFRLQEHVNRLFDSAIALSIQITSSKKEIHVAILQVVKKNKLAECYIRPIVTIQNKNTHLNSKNC